VYVEGRLETRKWTDKAGVERYTTDIIASDMKMLGSKPGSVGYEAPDREEGGFAPSSPSSKAPAKSSSGFDDMDDDIPF
jgi:single-strand DNA-binding protein